MIDRFLLPALTFFIFLLAYLSPVSYAGSDPHFTPLVAQSLIYHKTFALTPYVDAIPDQFTTLSYQTFKSAGQTVYTYPIGASLLSLPFVGVALLLGNDMSTPAHNWFIQNVVSAFGCAGLFVLSYLLCRRIVERRAALVIALVSLLGSSMISTLGTALWNQLGITLFGGLVLLELTRTKPRTLPLAGYLFAAYLCRPTAIVLIGFVIVYLLWTARKQAAHLALWLSGWVLLWMGGNYLVMERTVTPYYDLPLPWVTPLLIFVGLGVAGWGMWQLDFGRKTPLIFPIDGLLGLTISASRGLFILSPFTLVIGAAVLRLRRQLMREKLVWLLVGWILAVMAVAILTDNWSGGAAYGARMMTEAWPAMTLLTAYCWRELGERSSEKYRWLTGYLLLGGVGVVLNSGIGLFNQSTVRWNHYPETSQQHLFDWKFPQYTASPDQLDARLQSYWRENAPATAQALPTYPFDTPIRPESETTVWEIEGEKVRIYVRLGAFSAENTNLILSGGNAAAIQRITINDHAMLPVTENRFSLPTAQLYANSLNRIAIYFTEAPQDVTDLQLTFKEVAPLK